MKITPFHYQNKENKGFDVIDFVKAYDLNFNCGNIVKYLARAGRKTNDRLSDLRKAKDYLEREILHEEDLVKKYIDEQN